MLHHNHRAAPSSKPTGARRRMRRARVRVGAGGPSPPFQTHRASCDDALGTCRSRGCTRCARAHHLAERPMKRSVIKQLFCHFFFIIAFCCWPAAPRRVQRARRSTEARVRQGACLPRRGCASRPCCRARSRGARRRVRGERRVGKLPCGAVVPPSVAPPLPPPPRAPARGHLVRQRREQSERPTDAGIRRARLRGAASCRRGRCCALSVRRPLQRHLRGMRTKRRPRDARRRTCCR